MRGRGRIHGTRRVEALEELAICGTDKYCEKCNTKKTRSITRSLQVMNPNCLYEPPVAGGHQAAARDKARHHSQQHVRIAAA